jgi:multicomponent Na+:H+ antiporter subunit B
MADPAGMSVIVRVVVRWLFAFVLIFGFAVALFGHVSPGGGFAGGVIIACAYVLATLAFGAKEGPAAWMKKRASTLDAMGALALLALAFLGFLSGHFLHSWIGSEPELFELGSSTYIVLLNLAILLKVGAGLFAGFMAIVSFTGAATDADGTEAKS